MKNLVYLFIILFFITNILFGQKTTSDSKAIVINFTEIESAPIPTPPKKERNIPNLKIEIVNKDNIFDNEELSNNILDAEEQIQIKYRITNIGNATGKSISLLFNENPNLSYKTNFDIGNLEPNDSKEISLNITASKNVQTNNNNQIVANLSEKNNYNPRPLGYRFSTKKYEKPLLDFEIDVTNVDEQNTVVA